MRHRTHKERLEIAILYILGYRIDFIAALYGVSRAMPQRCAGWHWLRCPQRGNRYG
jgi:hypothetical protein